MNLARGEELIRVTPTSQQKQLLLEVNEPLVSVTTKDERILIYLRQFDTLQLVNQIRSPMKTLMNALRGTNDLTVSEGSEMSIIIDPLPPPND